MLSELNAIITNDNKQPLHLFSLQFIKSWKNNSSADKTKMHINTNVSIDSFHRQKSFTAAAEFNFLRLHVNSLLYLTLRNFLLRKHAQQGSYAKYLSNKTFKSVKGIAMI